MKIVMEFLGDSPFKCEKFQLVSEVIFVSGVKASARQLLDQALLDFDITQHRVQYLMRLCVI